MTTETRICLCEHESHFDDDGPKRAPNSQHAYGDQSKIAQGSEGLCAGCAGAGHFAPNGEGFARFLATDPDVAADPNMVALAAATEPTIAPGELWRLVRAQVAAIYGVPGDQPKFESAERFDRVYAATPDHVGTIEIVVNQPDRRADSIVRPGHMVTIYGVRNALVGVTKSGRAVVYQD